MQAQEALSNRMNRLEMVVGFTNWSSSVDLKHANEIPANETKDSNVESVGNLSQTVEALQRSTTLPHLQLCISLKILNFKEDDNIFFSHITMHLTTITI